MKEQIINFFKGIGVGTANVIPGVSGGTIALLTGIFMRLINALKSFDLEALRLLLRGRFKEFAKHIDFVFLCSVGLGVIVAILTIARLFDYLFEHYPVYLWSFFFGLILASIYYVGITISKWNIKVVISFLIGTATAVFIAFATPASENNDTIYLLICGAVATCSMILPGLSGSFVLLLMGNYQLVMIDSVNNLDLRILIPVAIGGIVGLLAFSHLLSWVFEKFRDITIALLTGFILGSMPIIYPWKNETTTFLGNKEVTTGYEYYLPEVNTQLAISVVLILLGIFIIIFTEKKAQSKSK